MSKNDASTNVAKFETQFYRVIIKHNPLRKDDCHFEVYKLARQQGGKFALVQALPRLSDAIGYATQNFLERVLEDQRDGGIPADAQPDYSTWIG